ncbi:MAG: hypothetical protein ACRDMZ_00790 [Solirubrobacteraceae bacterium]
MRTMQIHTNEGCRLSAQLRELLDERQTPYEETQIALDSPAHHELGRKAGSTKLPPALLGVIPLGSTQEVHAAPINGILDDLLDD